MPSRLDQYRVDERTNFSANFWNSVFGDVDARIAKTEGLEDTINAAIESLNKVGLDRINEVLVPAILSIQRTQRLGFLIASSATPQVLSVGNGVSLVCTGETAATFTPSPFVAITRAANYTDYAIARTISYDNKTGVFYCQILAIFGAIDGVASFNDWQISGSPGVVAAEQQMLAQVQAARQTTIEASDTATDAAQRAETAAEILEEAVLTGPVTKVNGQTGTVTLGPTDVGAYSKADVDAFFAALKGTADAAHDTLGELAAILDANATAISALAKRPAGGGSAGGPLLMI